MVQDSAQWHLTHSVSPRGACPASAALSSVCGVTALSTSYEGKHKPHGLCALVSPAPCFLSRLWRASGPRPFLWLTLPCATAACAPTHPLRELAVPPAAVMTSAKNHASTSSLEHRFSILLRVCLGVESLRHNLCLMFWGSSKLNSRNRSSEADFV